MSVYPWTVHGYPWIEMDIHGYWWISRAGVKWISNGYPLDIHFWHGYPFFVCYGELLIYPNVYNLYILYIL